MPYFLFLERTAGVRSRRSKEFFKHLERRPKLRVQRAERNIPAAASAATNLGANSGKCGLRGRP